VDMPSVSLGAGGHRVRSSGNPYVDVAAVLLIKGFRSRGSLPREETEPPGMSYRRINPSLYTIDLRSKGPCWLVLNEDFKGGWRLYQRKAGGGLSGNLTAGWSTLAASFQLKGKPAAAIHCPVNGGMNGWYLPKGMGDLILQYRPQVYFELSVLITLVFFLLISGCGLILIRRKGGAGE